jgi:hypothetical protein
VISGKIVLDARGVFCVNCAAMTPEDVKQEFEREPFIPLQLHLTSGANVNIEHANSAFVRQNTLLVVHRLAAKTAAIGNYDVIALRLIERITTMDGAKDERKRGRRSA